MQPGWTLAPLAPDLPGNTIHVWKFSLTIGANLSARFVATLSPNERDKLARASLPGLRNRQIAARGYLRAILARYLPLSPASLAFEYGAQGKPRLADGIESAEQPRLHFNMTHTENLGMVAVTQSGAVGLDVEDVTRHSNWSSLTKRTLSVREHHDLLELPKSLRQRAFATLWTRKEAYTKALGQGFQYGFRRFSISVDPRHPPQLLDDSQHPAAKDEWNLQSIHPGVDLIATLACRAKLWPGRYSLMTIEDPDTA